MSEHKLVICDSLYTEDSSVVIGGSAGVGEFALANLITPYPDEYWKSSGVSSIYIEVDLGQARSVYGIFLGYTNFRPPNSTAWRIRGATSQANLTNGSAVVDIGNPATVYALAEADYGSDYATDWPAGTDAFYYGGTPNQEWSEIGDLRWWRIDPTDASHPDQFFRAAVLRFLGPGFNPASGLAKGGIVPPSERVFGQYRRTKSGVLVPRDVVTPRMGKFDYGFNTLSETAEVNKLQRSRRGARDVVAVYLDGQGSSQNSVMHGVVTDVAEPRFSADDAATGGRWRRSVTIESMGSST